MVNCHVLLSSLRSWLLKLVCPLPYFKLKHVVSKCPSRSGDGLPSPYSVTGSRENSKIAQETLCLSEELEGKPFPTDNFHCLSCNLKEPEVGKRSHMFSHGMLSHGEKVQLGTPFVSLSFPSWFLLDVSISFEVLCLSVSLCSFIWKPLQMEHSELPRKPPWDP